jgi:hypothetical protein
MDPDVIHQGETWRRSVHIIDGTGAPYDPATLVAVLCPETPITVSRDAVPVAGTYYVTLTETETAAACPGRRHWELLARVGSDAMLLIHQELTIEPSCARLP